MFLSINFFGKFVYDMQDEEVVFTSFNHIEISNPLRMIKDIKRMIQRSGEWINSVIFRNFGSSVIII